MTQVQTVPATASATTQRSTANHLAGLGGLAFTVLAVASVAVAPMPPAVDASAQEIREYLNDHGQAFGISSILMVLTMFAGSAFFVWVHHRLAAVDRVSMLPTWFLTSTTTVITFAISGAVLQGLLARHISGEIDDSTLVGLYLLWNFLAYMTPPLLMGLAWSILAVRCVTHRVFPVWIGVVAGASAIGGLVTGLIAIGTSTKPPTAIDTGSFLLACVVMSAISIHSLRSTSQ